MKRTGQARIFYEDFEPGFEYVYPVAGLSAEEIREFAQKYDPQRFHLDQAAAAKTHFGGLVASGFQTQLQCFEPFCREVLADTRAVGAPGIDALKWLRPWYPGEVLAVTVSLLDKRLSSTRDDRGYLRFRLEAGAEGAPTLAMEWTVIMLTRKASSAS